MRNSIYGLYCTSWRRVIAHGGIQVLKLDTVSKGFRSQCFSTQQAHTLQLPKVAQQLSIEEETHAFYVVRKGDIIGIYKSLSDCQAQVSSSVCDPSVSVYKGYHLHKGTEDYLASIGLKSPLYTIDAADVKDDLFGTLVPCPFKQPDGLAFLAAKLHEKSSAQKISEDAVKDLMTCIVEFDGASKGNPGKAGAGAILRTEDGNVICRVREGLGVATCNVAEYRALILGLKHALQKGFKQIRVRGDSKLICFQVDDRWRAKKQHMVNLHEEVKGLKDMFRSFSISHVRREFNSDADAQANLAVDLPLGEVCEESGELC